MFDSYAVLSAWGMVFLREAAREYRGIVEIRDVQVSMVTDEGDALDHGSIDHVCQSWCAYPRSGVYISGIGVRRGGSEVQLSHEIDADSFSFETFLDEIQELA